MGVVLEEGGGGEVEYLTTSRTSAESTYATWAHFFSEGYGIRSTYVVELSSCIACRCTFCQAIGKTASPDISSP